MFHNANDFGLKSQNTNRIPPGGFASIQIYDQSTVDKQNSKSHSQPTPQFDVPKQYSSSVDFMAQDHTQRKVHVSEDARAMVEGAKKFMLFQLKRRGTGAGLQLQQKLESMDTSGDGVVSFSEFRDALMQLNMAENQIHCLFRYFDADCNGYLNKQEFLDGVIPQLNSRRARLAEAAFGQLDLNGNDIVDLAETAMTYNVNQHPDFLNGKKSKNQILTEFLEGFGKVEEGQITLKQWLAYYRYIGALIDDDDYFELMMRNAWNMDGNGVQSGSRFSKYSQQQQQQQLQQQQQQISSAQNNNKVFQLTSIRKPSGQLGSQRISKITQASIAFG